MSPETRLFLCQDSRMDSCRAGSLGLGLGFAAILGGRWGAPLTRKRHTMPHSAQSQHINYWAPRTRKRHQQEHRPQRPTESSDPTQHAKGRTGDRPGPRKGATTRRNVTQGGGGLEKSGSVASVCVGTRLPTAASSCLRANKGSLSLRACRPATVFVPNLIPWSALAWSSFPPRWERMGPWRATALSHPLPHIHRMRRLLIIFTEFWLCALITEFALLNTAAADKDEVRVWEAVGCMSPVQCAVGLWLPHRFPLACGARVDHSTCRARSKRMCKRTEMGIKKHEDPRSWAHLLGLFDTPPPCRRGGQHPPQPPTGKPAPLLMGHPPLRAGIETWSIKRARRGTAV